MRIVDRVAATLPALVVIGGVELLAQDPAPAQPKRVEFEVASIKPNKSGAPFQLVNRGAGGRYTATNMSLGSLIRSAYAIRHRDQLIGGPAWLESDRFDVVAKADANAPQTDFPVMLRALLEDRFKLVVRMETRELPIYELIMARSDGKLGPSLQRSDVDCAAVAKAREGNRDAVAELAKSGGRPICGMQASGRRMAAGGLPIRTLVGSLSGSAGRLINDRTGLDGNFDWDLEWAPESDPNGPSIFTALQEQLGLKLQPSRGPVEVVVVEHVEPPTPD
jgi:uncharacterized protein (TIGR03435 family)